MQRYELSRGLLWTYLSFVFLQIRLNDHWVVPWNVQPLRTFLVSFIPEKKNQQRFMNPIQRRMRQLGKTVPAYLAHDTHMQIMPTIPKTKMTQAIIMIAQGKISHEAATTLRGCRAANGSRIPVAVACKAVDTSKVMLDEAALSKIDLKYKQDFNILAIFSQSRGASREMGQSNITASCRPKNKEYQQNTTSEKIPNPGSRRRISSAKSVNQCSTQFTSYVLSKTRGLTTHTNTVKPLRLKNSLRRNPLSYKKKKLIKLKKKNPRRRIYCLRISPPSSRKSNTAAFILFNTIPASILPYHFSHIYKTNNENRNRR